MKKFEKAELQVINLRGKVGTMAQTACGCDGVAPATSGS